MNNDHRPGDFVDALGKGLVIYYTFPLLAALIGGLGMLVGLILAIPCYLILWISPEQFLVQHTNVFFVFWGLGMAMVMKRMFFRETRVVSQEIWSSFCWGILFIFGSLLLVLLIAGSLAFLAHMDVDWARRALDV